MIFFNGQVLWNVKCEFLIMISLYFHFVSLQNFRFTFKMKGLFYKLFH